MEQEIINYILKSFRKMWLDDFELINNYPKYNNLPSIVWKNLLHYHYYLSSKFPEIDDYFSQNTFDFLIIALDSFILSNPLPNQILDFIQNFLIQIKFQIKFIRLNEL